MQAHGPPLASNPLFLALRPQVSHLDGLFLLAGQLHVVGFGLRVLGRRALQFTLLLFALRAPSIMYSYLTTEWEYVSLFSSVI